MFWGRGYRWWFRLTGLPGWMRFGFYSPWMYTRGPAPPYAEPSLPPEEELRMLEEEKQMLEDQLEEIKARIEELKRKLGR